MVQVLNGPCKSVWINSSGLEVCVFEGGKGFAFILPDRQGSQTGSGASFDFILIPVTSCLEFISLTELW